MKINNDARVKTKRSVSPDGRQTKEEKNEKRDTIQAFREIEKETVIH
jgi:hypothetical protein